MSMCGGGGAIAALDETVAEYLPAVEGLDPTDLFAIVAGGRDIGLIQTYLVGDYPGVGDPDRSGRRGGRTRLSSSRTSLLGRGLGAEVIRLFVATVVFARAATRACVADPDVRNVASVRAFEKAGFTAVRTFFDPEDGQLHALMRLDRTPPESRRAGVDACCNTSRAC